MFDAETRKANQENLRGFGDTFAGPRPGRRAHDRGAAAAARAPAAGDDATSPTPSTQLTALLRRARRRRADRRAGLRAAGRACSPRWPTRSRRSAATRARSSRRSPTRRRRWTSRSSPSACSARSWPTSRASATTSRPATAELRGALPTLNRADRRRDPGQQARAASSTRSSARRSTSCASSPQAPGTLPGVRGLGATVTTLNPQLKFYGPYVTVCNSPNYFFTYLAEHFSEPDTTGSAQRALANTAGPQDDGVGSMGADEPANGQNAKEGTPQYAQNQPYAAAITPDGRADCETGQRGWLERNAGGLDASSTA